MQLDKQWGVVMRLDDQLAWGLVLVWRWPGWRIVGRKGAWGVARGGKRAGFSLAIQMGMGRWLEYQ